MDELTIIGLVKSAWENSIPDRRLAALQALEKMIAPDKIALFHAVVDLVKDSIADDPGAMTVVLIHGIRTDGAWHQLVAKAFSTTKGVNAHPVTYGFFTALGLFGPFRGGPVAKVARELRDLRRQEPLAKIVVIAHSYGTYIVSKLLTEEVDIRFEKIIFCGSIVSRNFRWDVLAPEHGKASILNDVGTNDFYPILAACSTFGYGGSGRLGFQTVRVTDRFFNYGHSDFFTLKHIRKFWVPFILDGAVVSSNWDAKRPKTPYLVNVLSKGPAVVAILITLLLCFVFAVAALTKSAVITWFA